MVADDLALVVDSPLSMQILLDEAETDASNEHYLFSTTKTKALVPNIRSIHTPAVNFSLNGCRLSTSTEEVHLGIHHTQAMNNKTTFQARIQSARKAAYSLMAPGLHGMNGIGPAASKKVWDTYVMPVLLHGLEALILTKKEIDQLEDYHQACMRQIQHLPDSTANSAVYLLIGSIPLECLLHI